MVDGVLVGGDGSEVQFRPSDDSTFFRILGIGARPLRAYGCTRCGRVQFVASFTPEDRQRYLDFEGEPQRSAIDTSSDEESQA
jgi:hypothetical protein